MIEWLEWQPNMMIVMQTIIFFYFLVYSLLSVKLHKQESLVFHVCLFVNLVFGAKKNISPSTKKGNRAKNRGQVLHVCVSENPSHT